VPWTTYYDPADLVDRETFLARHPDRTGRDFSMARNHENERARKKGLPKPYPSTYRQQGAPPVIPPIVSDAQAAVDVASVEAYRHAERAVPTLDVKPEPTPEQWEILFQALEATNEARGDLSPDMKRTTFTAPDALPLGVAFLSDVHAGASGVRYDLFKRDLDLIRNTDGLYVCGNGDYLEGIKPQAKNGTALYSGLFNDPQEQLAYIVHRMRICKGRWLCVGAGNHDQYDAVYAGISRLPQLAHDLGAPYFSEAGGEVKVILGGETYVLIVKHQWAGQSRLNTSNSARRAYDEYPTVDTADVIALGHLHYPDLQQVPRKGQIVTYLRSGSYKTHDGWAESKGFRPMYGVPVCVLMPDRHKVVAFTDIEDGVRFLTAERARYRALNAH